MTDDDLLPRLGAILDRIDPVPAATIGQARAAFRTAAQAPTDGGANPRVPPARPSTVQPGATGRGSGPTSTSREAPPVASLLAPRPGISPVHLPPGGGGGFHAPLPPPGHQRVRTLSDRTDPHGPGRRRRLLTAVQFVTGVLIVAVLLAFLLGLVALGVGLVAYAFIYFT